MDNRPEPVVSGYFRWKRYIDLIVAVPLSLLALPMVIAAVVLVRLTSKGPGIYSQVRLGQDGKPFTIYKIRSMRLDAEVATGAVWATKKDNRITIVGKILRATHVDELPQLYNVLRGEMALVGPRPERPHFVSILEKRLEGYEYRLMVPPGITGLAQLNQDGDQDLNDVRRKMIYDVDYIENSSFFFDMTLLFCTSLKAVFLCRPAVMKLFGIYRVALESSWADSFLPSKYMNAGDEERISFILKKGTIV